MLLTFLLLLIFVGLCPLCKKRENLWIFVLTAIVFIPANVCILIKIFGLIEDYMIFFHWYVKALLFIMGYIFVFCVEEIFMGLVGRILWKGQYLLSW